MGTRAERRGAIDSLRIHQFMMEADGKQDREVTPTENQQRQPHDPDARVDTSHHKGHHVLGVEREEQEKGVGEGV